MENITNTKIASIFNISRDSLHRWKSDPEKYPGRYELYKLGAYLYENDIMPEEVVGLAAQNKKLRNDIEELLDHVASLVHQ